MNDHDEAVSLHRYALIAEAVSNRVSSAERGRWCATWPASLTRIPMVAPGSTPEEPSTVGSAPIGRTAWPGYAR